MNDTHTQQANTLIGKLQHKHDRQLTIFLNATPEMDKTYAILSRTREHLRQNMDMIANMMETHRRSETAALLKGLPLLPHARINYQDHILKKLNLDALLAHKPQLALINELAHRNMPDSRHKRRWQDIMKLLDTDIDIYTTVNIQHLENLNDIVLHITDVHISETVPDAIFDHLRDIILVNLPPRELIERLQQNKMYLPEQTTQALQAFFSPSNLTALRELAIQTATNRINSDLRDTQTTHDLPGTATLRRRVIIAIDSRNNSNYLVHVTRRLSKRHNAP